MTQHRPDLLPFALNRAIGCPYHGLVVDGVLTLPNGQTQARSILSGETHYVQHPKAAALSRTTEEQAADTAAGRQWKTYALLTGDDREICGEELSAQTGQIHWLYCDANIAWDVCIEWSKSARSITIDCYLEKPFGVFTNTDLSMTRRKLATTTFTPKQYNGTDQTLAQAALGRTYFASHDKTGAKTAINVAAIAAPLSQPWSKTYLVRTSGATTLHVGVHNSLSLQISGNGSLTPGTIGAGISGTFASLATAPEMIISDDDGFTYEYPCEEEPTYGRYATWYTVYEYRFFYAYDKDSTLTKITHSFSQTCQYNYSATNCGEYPPDPVEPGTAQAVCNTINSLSFGGTDLVAETASIVDSVTGDQIYLDTNGVQDAAGDVLPYDIHSNVVLFWLIAGAASEAKIVAADGTFIAPTWASDRPKSSNTSWEPGLGVITFTEGKTQGYV